MHRKAVFALAGVFLTVALVVPPALFIIQANTDLDKLIVIQNNMGLVTGGNATISNQISANHTNTLVIFTIIEAVFLPLFAVTLYYGINHPHPHGKEKEEPEAETESSDTSPSKPTS